MIQGTDASTRRLPSFIEAFVEATNGLKSPPIFRRWAAISAIAGALEKKVWITTDQGDIFPNMYILLVGPPGVGKGEALKTLRYLWSTLGEDFHVASSTVTHASMLDELKEAHRKIFRPADASPLTEFHSLQVASTEFSTFLPVYDTTFMSYLQQWYDCEDVAFSESRRGRKKGQEFKNTIKAPQVSLIAGTTPDFLGKLLPEGAWNQGFCARVIPIFSDSIIQVKFWNGARRSPQLMDHLVHDLKQIHETFGQLIWEPEAAFAMQEWVAMGAIPLPTHPRLINYNTRRPVHLFKLTAVCCISRADHNMTITLQDFATALDLLISAEDLMPGIFNTMVSSIDSGSMDDVMHFVLNEFKKHGPVSVNKVIRFIAHHTATPSYNVLRMYETLKATGQLRVYSVGEKGNDLVGPA